MTEEQVEQIGDGYAESALPERDVVALQLTDAIIYDPTRVTPALQAALRQHFSDAQIVELALGVGLCHALSKLLIILGLEPEGMPTTMLPTPGGDR